MQFRLLNYYKMLANIAGNLVGAFVPLIIYEATESLMYAVLFLVGVSLFRLIISISMHKVIQKTPEIFLMLRFFTIGAYCSCLAFLSVNLVLFAILSAIFLAFDRCFKSLSIETILNYSSGEKMDSKKIGFTRMFEKFGIFAGLIVGGLLLDVNQIVVYVMAISIYTIAIVPLFMFYLKNRKRDTFNAELTSNATLELSKGVPRTGSLKYLILSMLAIYSFMYFLIGVLDITTNVFNLSNFALIGISYTSASIINIVYNIAELIANLIISKVDKKYDLMNVARIGFVVLSAVFVVFAFVKSSIVLYIAFALFGFTYVFISSFLLQRLVQKTRILGVSNTAFCVREWFSLIAYIVFYLIVMIFAIFDIHLRLFFIVTSVIMLLCSFIFSKLEEKTRKMLVDFVEDNEIIVDNHSIKR